MAPAHHGGLTCSGMVLISRRTWPQWKEVSSACSMQRVCSHDACRNGPPTTSRLANCSISLKLVMAFKEMRWYMIKFAQVVQHVSCVLLALCLLIEYHCCRSIEISSSRAFVAAFDKVRDALV